MKLGEHLLVIGKTGSGKTVRAISALKQLHAENPDAGILIINHKADADIINQVKPLKKIPSRFRKGDIVHVCPLLGDEEAEEAINNLLRDVYKIGNTIVYIDEGLMIPASNKEMLAIQTQGRSKKISAIVLSQRPKFISLFAVTQASVIDIFNVQGRDDIKTLENVVRPKNEKLEDLIDDLKPFHFLEYDKDGIRIEKPLPYPIRGSIKPPKKPFPLLKIAAFSAAALLTFLLRN